VTYDPRGRPAAAPLVGLRRRPFELALRVPMETAHGPIASRAGAVLELLDGEGRRGLGEASPLLAWGDGDAADVLRLLDAHAQDVLEDGRLPDGATGPGSAALRCAIDVAQLDLEAQRRGVPIAWLLSDRPRARVEVNAVIGDGSPAQAVVQANAAWAAGHRTLKLKVGAAQAEQDRRRVEAVRDALPDATLRLDANGGWDEITAAAALERLSGYRIELVEQPVATDATDTTDTTEALARLRRAQLCRIAADEAVTSLAAGRDLLTAEAADVLVLKPMRLGGLRPALTLAREAAERGVPCIVTTTFDAAVGVAAALHLAAALPIVATLPGPAHGLATADHLAADLVTEPLRPRDGAMALPRVPGLGIRLDEHALEAAATGAWFALRA